MNRTKSVYSCWNILILAFPSILYQVSMLKKARKSEKKGANKRKVCNKLKLKIIQMSENCKKCEKMEY